MSRAASAAIARKRRGRKRQTRGIAAILLESARLEAAGKPPLTQTAIAKAFAAQFAPHNRPAALQRGHRMMRRDGQMLRDAGRFRVAYHELPFAAGLEMLSKVQEGWLGELARETHQFLGSHIELLRQSGVSLPTTYSLEAALRLKPNLPATAARATRPKGSLLSPRFQTELLADLGVTKFRAN